MHVIYSYLFLSEFARNKRNIQKGKQRKRSYAKNRNGLTQIIRTHVFDEKQLTAPLLFYLCQDYISLFMHGFQIH